MELPIASGRIVLGIETSCDETAAALVADDRRILCDLIASQDEHAAYGGVVPEIAARAHLLQLDRLVQRAMDDAKVGWADLAGIAVTAGPGLIGGLVVGLVTARTLALVHGLPLLPVNHLIAHALTARLTHALERPYLLLLVSGGHCQLVAVEGVGSYRRLGTTIDDAAGEAFDKVARMIGLGYPGGPAVERAAATGDPTRFALPRPLLGQPGCDFSFSGLKTAVRTTILGLGSAGLTAAAVADLCAGFQAAVGDVLADRTGHALSALDRGQGPPPLVLAGGVAANRYLRRRLEEVGRTLGAQVILPPPRLCSDNAVMVAWAGIEALATGASGDLEARARPRWPLDPKAEPRLGSGQLGAKA